MGKTRRHLHVVALGLVIVLALTFAAGAVETNPEGVDPRVAQLEARVAQLEERLASLESLVEELLRHVTGESGNADSAQDGKDAAATPPEADTSWKRMNQNWEYRNASVHPGTSSDNFLVELRRVGPPISFARLTVTLYDDAGRIVTTGSRSVESTGTGDIKTVKIFLDSKADNARTFRLQVDYEF